MKESLDRQLAAFEPPRNIRIFHNRVDTTVELRGRVVRWISELDELVKLYGG
jgi:hypothetical protein